MYLKKSGQTWVACHEISEDLRPFFGGRPRFKRSTGERDKSLAKAVAAGFEAEWRQQIARARRFGGDPAAAEYADLVEIDQALAAIGNGEQPFDPAKPWQAPPPAVPPSPAFATHVEEWLATLVNDTPKTRHMKGATVKKIQAEFPRVADVNKKAVQKWINGLLEDDVKVATIRRSLSELRGYWSFLQSLDIVSAENEPFHKLVLPKAQNGNRKAFEPGQVVALVAAAVEAGDDELADLCRLAAFTGGRIEELCTLRIEDLRDNLIICHGTKTEAAPRQIPIHPDLKPTLARLKGKRTEGFLFKDLTTNKFGDRSNAVGKRFGHMKADQGYGDEHTFHSIRKTWSTMLWSAGCQREMISQLMGHKTGNITTDVYATDPDFKAKQRAVFKLRYPGYVPV